MEGSELPATMPSGPVTKRRSKKTNLLIVLAAIVVTVIMVTTVVMIYLPSKGSADLPYGLKGGDHFVYAATGTFNNTNISGFYKVALIGNVSRNVVGGYSYLNSTIPELNRLLNAQIGFSLLSAQGFSIGVGKIETPFGIKDVFQVFRVYDGGTVVYYQGYNPQVIYGCVINAPNLHLDLVLNQTNNQYAIENNTLPLEWQTQTPTPSGNGIPFRFGPEQNFTDLFYFSNGANLSYNISAGGKNGPNIYCYNEANMQSMANGGPYAYDLRLTRLDFMNETVGAILPTGFFELAFYGGNSSGEYRYNAEVF
jgi:hypothetical protein